MLPGDSRDARGILKANNRSSKGLGSSSWERERNNNNKKKKYCSHESPNPCLGYRSPNYEETPRQRGLLPKRICEEGVVRTLDLSRVKRAVTPGTRGQRVRCLGKENGSSKYYIYISSIFFHFAEASFFSVIVYYDFFGGVAYLSTMLIILYIMLIRSVSCLKNMQICSTYCRVSYLSLQHTNLIMHRS